MFEKIFLQLLNMSFTASLVIIFVVIARLVFKKAPKIFSYCLWAVVLFRLVCPFSFESVLSLLPANTTPIPTEIIYAPVPQIETGIVPIDNMVNPVLPVPEVGASVNPLQIWAFIGQIVWIAGIVILLCYSAYSFIKLRRQIKNSVNIEGNIYVSQNVSTPFVLGIIRPKIYLPAGLTSEETRYVVMHERTHIKRLDHIIKLISFLVLCVYWFNPLVWAAFFLCGNDMEMSCDEAVIKKMGGSIKKDYSSSLLSFATGRRLVGGVPLSFGEGSTKHRIINVLNYKKPGFWVIITALIAVVAVSLGLMANPTAESLPETGKCGDNLTWSYSNGVLKIYGSGDMYNFYTSAVTESPSAEVSISVQGNPEGASHWYKYADNIKTVIIDNRCTSIGENAFANHTNIKRVNLPDNLSKIGENAFLGCKLLKKLNLPDGVKYINDYAFAGCKSLEKVAVPTGVERLGFCAFMNCTGLSEAEIPQNITFLNGYVFSGCEKLSKVTLPQNIEKIPEGLFMDCKSLKKIALPDSVTAIGERAFYGCTSLEGIKLPDGLCELEEFAFYKCSRLDNVKIPSGLKNIGARAFGCCRGLESLEISEGVKAIDSYAFENCESLKTVTMPDSMYRIGRNAFSDCRGLENINLNDGLAVIENAAFFRCERLCELYIPESVNRLGNNFTSGCKRLSSYTWGKNYNGKEYAETLCGEWSNKMFTACKNGMTNFIDSSYKDYVKPVAVPESFMPTEALPDIDYNREITIYYSDEKTDYLGDVVAAYRIDGTRFMLFELEHVRNTWDGAHYIFATPIPADISGYGSITDYLAANGFKVSGAVSRQQAKLAA